MSRFILFSMLIFAGGVAGAQEAPLDVPATPPPPPATAAAPAPPAESAVPGARVKEPFMLPNHIYAKLKKNTVVVPVDNGEGKVDDKVHPKQRWALKFYKLVAIVWNVRQPKAMILDKEKKMQMYYLQDQIGNGGGRITAIRDGEVVVREKDADLVIKLRE